MLAAPIVAIVDPGLIPGTLIMLATLVTLIVVSANARTSTCPAPAGHCVGRVPGTVAGALLLAALPHRALAILLAGVVLGWASCSTSCGWIPAARRRNVVLAGATSGVLGTATSIGGPPMALVWQRNGGARLRGTMSGFFLVGSVMSLVALALTGAVDGHTLATFAVLMPAALVGLRAVPLRQPVPRSRTPALAGDRGLRASAPSVLIVRGAGCDAGRRHAQRPRVRKVKSAVRTVELLEFLAARHDEPARHARDQRALDMPRSSAHALLRTLVERRAGCGPTPRAPCTASASALCWSERAIWTAIRTCR